MMNVYFTVDTESSMGGAWRDAKRQPLSADRHIFCRTEGQDYGIGLITRILSEYGFKATHFVEMLATLVNGEADTQRVFDFLLAREQDVQLHIHPTYLFFAEAKKAAAAKEPYRPPQQNDFLCAFDEERQTNLLGEGIRLFERFAGKRPVAFRAGSFAANRTTLQSLRRMGIFFDSSYNPCWPSWSFAGERLEPNRVSRIEGVWELPPAVGRTPIPEGYGGFKMADPSSVSVAELCTMLEGGVAQGQEHFVIVFHSFSAVKPKDETYAQTRPDRIVIRRLEKLAEYLSNNSNLYEVSTFGKLATETSLTESATTPLSRLGIGAATVRKAVQAVNRCYWL
jgi:hypothetical protein